MMTAQPSYFCIANLGDANPFEHGGAFVCIDRRGIYDPILLIYDEDFRKRSEVTLEPCHRIMSSTGEIIAVGTNKFHATHPEWFSDSLNEVADFYGRDFDEIVNELVSGDAVLRAGIYLALIGYHGVNEFDHYPYIYESEKEAKRFCDQMLMQIQESKTWWDGYFNTEKN
jgi:hypothetical protein